MGSAVDLNELERELCRIPEVTAARVVAGQSGLIEEVHILALPQKHAKQVVRDVQSVAQATFGLDLDRRIVSVVQLEAPAPSSPAPDPALVALAEALDVSIAAPPPMPPPVPPASAPEAASTGAESPTSAASRTSTFSGLDAPVATNGVDLRINVDTVTATRSSHECTAEVVLSRGTDISTGTADGLGATSSVLRLVAQATIAALRLLEPAAIRADVEAAMVVNLGGRLVALTTVVLVVPPYEEVCAGSAVVRSAGELDAVARAVLDATNRRLPQLR